MVRVRLTVIRHEFELSTSKFLLILLLIFISATSLQLGLSLCTTFQSYNDSNVVRLSAP